MQISAFSVRHPRLPFATLSAQAAKIIERKQEGCQHEDTFRASRVKAIAECFALGLSILGGGKPGSKESLRTRRSIAIDNKLSVLSSANEDAVFGSIR